MVDELISVLREIDGDAAVVAIRYVDAEHAFPAGNAELIEKAGELAEKYLINPQGGNNLAAHELLKVAGFPVFCGDHDGFGWLTGCIKTSKGVIVYG